MCRTAIYERVPLEKTSSRPVSDSAEEITIDKNTKRLELSYLLIIIE
jgi:hypothetical protein